MGLKRIMFQAEAVYPADDSRELDTLKAVTAEALSDGLIQHSGSLARITVVSAAVDPDPESTVPTPLPEPEAG